MPIGALKDESDLKRWLERQLANAPGNGQGGGGLVAPPPSGAAGGVLSGYYPNPGFAADMATQAELNAAISGLSATYQPLDSDLTAIAALTTTAFGRAFLALADAAAARAYIGAAASSHTHLRADLPSAIAYEDEANTFTLAQIIDLSGSGDVLTLDIGLSGESYLKLTEGGADRLNVQDISNGVRFQTTQGPLTLSAGSTFDVILDAAGDIDASSNRIKNVTDPTSAQDAATKNFVTTGYQPLDSDLTAIAALTTTSFGRSVLEAANAAALRTLAGLGTMATEAASSYQPIDSDLTAIAALTTTAFGRSVLELADAAAARTLFGLVIGTNVQAYDADLAAIAALTTTSYGRSVLEAADASALRTLAGLVIGTNVQAFDSDLASIAALTTTSYGRSLLEAANAAGLRTLAGLVIGTDVTAFADSRIPTQSENDALVGTYGTPSSTVPFVTDTDPRISAATPALSDAILALDPSLYWTLGSGGSGLTDQSGNSRNGTGQGSVTVGGGASLTSDGGASTDFDGSNDAITSSYAPFVTSAKRTIVGFAIRDTISSNDVLFGGDGADPPYLQIKGNPPTSGGAVEFTPGVGSGSTSWTNAWSDATGVATAWALVIDDAAATAELFINGVSKGKQTAVSYATPGNFAIAGYGTSGATSSFDGKMAHVAVYEKALSPASIAWLANIGLGRLGQRDWGFVSTLPSNPVYGDRCSYIADSTNGVIWQLVYDGQGTYPWKFIGGSPMITTVDTSETFTDDATYQDPATAGPTVTPPLAGDYSYVASCNFFHATAAIRMDVGLKVGAAAAGTAPHDAIMISPGANLPFTLAFNNRLTGLAASTALKLMYSATAAAGNANVRWRTLAVTPVRVG